jgi:hypothetical protein
VIGQAGAGAEPSGGAGGEPACRHPQTLRLPVEADTWLDAAASSARHGGDELLAVMAGASERRAIFALTLPPTPPGTLLERATFVLDLTNNADISLAERRLGLHRLTTAFDEARASWSRYDAGSKWQQAGGDFGPEVASAVVPAGMANGDVSFDVTQTLGKILATSSVALAWLVLETPDHTSGFGELSFISRDQVVLEIPTLVLEYCDE